MDNKDIKELNLKSNATDNVVNVVNNKAEVKEVKSNKFAKVMHTIFVKDAPLKVVALLTSVAIWIMSNGFTF